MLLTLIKPVELEHFSLPVKINGRHWITHHDNMGHRQNLLSVAAENGAWVIHSGPNAALLDDNRPVQALPLESGRFYQLQILQASEQALLYVQQRDTAENIRFRKMALPLSGEITIGRQKGCDICFENRFVSGKHAAITIKQDSCEVKDTESQNGTFVNGRRIAKSILLPGDVVYIMGLLLVIGKGMVAVNNPGGAVTVNFSVLPLLAAQARAADFGAGAPSQPDFYYCSPRFYRKIQSETLDIDAPPQKELPEPTPLALLIGPALTMASMSMVTGAVAVLNLLGGSTNLLSTLPSIVMSAVMLISAVVWPSLARHSDRRRHVRREEQRQKKYTLYLENMRQALTDISVTQAQVLRENVVTVEDCRLRILKKTRNLWERMPEHDDFLSLRIGIGDLPIRADIRFPQQRFSLGDDPMNRLLQDFAAEPKLLRQVPVAYSLRERQISAVIGPRGRITEFVKGLLVQLIALHNYDEVKLVFLCDKNEAAQWAFARWLPHCTTADNSLRMYAYTLEDCKIISAFLEKELIARLNTQEPAAPKPHYLMVAASQTLAAKANILTQLHSRPGAPGFSVLYMYDSLDKLPRECSMVVDLDGAEPLLYDRSDITGNRVCFIPDIGVRYDPEPLAVQLANTHMELSGDQYILPEMLTFLELFGVGRAEHLNPLQRWKENNPVLSLRTPVGVDTLGDPFFLDLHEKFHGPHGLVAGMTGSGKSEFIITFILSMAVNYHPDEVSFILIDYKGGGLAGAFENKRARLPHLAGTITNLDGPQIHRALASIQSELRRRQRLFNQACQQTNEGTIDIYKYQMYHRSGVVKEPLPHLFIISDEFAELKAQQSDFMEQLVSAARIGRSLGVHLILATQKPSGVVDDQIWSNSRFRVCLKVQEKADSVDMLKRPDAAALKETGRFYLQVGYGEIFAVGQSAWAGAGYLPADTLKEKRDDTVAVLDNTGQVVRKARPARRSAGTLQHSQSLAILEHLALMAAEEGIQAKNLWLPPIPKVITARYLVKKYGLPAEAGYRLDLVIGEYDDPSNQRQALLTLPLSAEGNAIVYGVTGSGKTSFLSILAHDIISRHTPRQVNLYIMDFGAETLKMYSAAPHVGEVITAGDDAKVESLFRMLALETERRKKILVAAGGSFHAYNREPDASRPPLPSIVVMINNYDVFTEQYEDLASAALVNLAREGTRAGLYFVLAASNTGAVRYRTAQHFPLLFTLQLTDKMEYSGVLGNTGGVLPTKVKGRGLIRLDKVYEYQTAYPTDNADNIMAEMESFSKNAAVRWPACKAPAVPAMPKAVTLEHFKHPVSRAYLPLGLADKTFDTVAHDFGTAPLLMILSDDLADARAMLAVLLQAVRTVKNTAVTLIDPLTCQAGQGPTVRVGKQVADLFNTVLTRNNEYKTRIENGEALPEYPQTVYMMNGLSDIWERLTEDEAEKLTLAFERNAPAYNVGFIIADSAAGASGFALSGWYKQQVAAGFGLWIGNRITDQNCLGITALTKDMYKAVERGYGYYVARGSAGYVKLLSAPGGEEG